MCAETGKRIKQLFLRSCSPNHNLIECQWKVFRKKVLKTNIVERKNSLDVQ
ncbi:hypothetical protein HMPREF1991_00064 [Hoylesella loescheii DSM 19665 = JCM 12249 = ATCC 15930]|uniref:Uncharacterized protein n=1 Tax=Hoylesella loescheii DSM 19665 = JCM 12249 = ATCC 15930 TaxID=1122985 RepID=A0A069QM30_HOYLO|nr:hypothetical protein HMPREF1991_00064 [Hoylesella loescheii DSM 19665 = JCM 12249 = ATCC 15930]